MLLSWHWQIWGEKTLLNNKKEGKSPKHEIDQYLKTPLHLKENTILGSVEVPLSSVQDGMYALSKAHMRSTPSLRSFPNVALETVPILVWLMIALSHPLKEDCWALPLSTPLSSRRSMVWCPWLCARKVVSQAPQHFRSYDTQATCGGCFVCQSICSVTHTLSSVFMSKSEENWKDFRSKHYLTCIPSSQLPT